MPDKTNSTSISSLNTKFCSVLKTFGSDSACLPSCQAWLLLPLSRRSGQDSRKTPPHFSVQKLACGCLQALSTWGLHEAVRAPQLLSALLHRGSEVPGCSSTSIKTPKNAGDSRARQEKPRARQPCGLPEVSKHGVNRGALILTPTTSLFVSQSKMPKARERHAEWHF